MTNSAAKELSQEHSISDLARHPWWRYLNHLSRFSAAVWLATFCRAITYSIDRLQQLPHQELQQLFSFSHADACRYVPPVLGFPPSRNLPGVSPCSASCQALSTCSFICLKGTPAIGLVTLHRLQNGYHKIEMRYSKLLTRFSICAENVDLYTHTCFSMQSFSI